MIVTARFKNGRSGLSVSDMGNAALGWVWVKRVVAGRGAAGQVGARGAVSSAPRRKRHPSQATSTMKIAPPATHISAPAIC